MFEAIFTEEVNTVTITGLTQWDHGITFKIKGLNLDRVTEVHFENVKLGVALIRWGVIEESTGDTVVAIPNDILTMPHDFKAWVVEVDEKKAKTIKTVLFPLVLRAQPADYVYANDDAAYTVLNELTEYVNTTYEKIVKISEDTYKAEQKFETDMTTRQNQFETRLNQAETARTQAESARVQAENTRVSQENARQTAETARSNAESGRASAEAQRVTAEKARAAAETTRQQNETTRQNQESTRQTQESTRQTNETNRQTEWDRLKEEIEGVISQGLINDNVIAALTTWSSQKINDALNGKSPSTHNHDGTYAPIDHRHTKSQITDFAHDHDNRYYTETEIDAMLGTQVTMTLSDTTLTITTK